jgi:pimeloyl-ACP methyl ester carboxylesterase
MPEGGTVAHRLRGREGGWTRYLRCGRGEAVILIHGVGMNASVWDPQTRALSRDHELVAYDLLGHGGSSLPPADASLSDYSDQLLSLMDALGIDRAHLVGHSMGALVALEFALTHPGRLSRVAALNAVYCRTAEQRQAVQRRAQSLEHEGDPTANEGTIARWFGDPVPSQLAGQAELVRELLRSVDAAGYARTYRLFARSDEAHRGRLQDLAVPALFMTGELDPNSSPVMSRAMAAAAPQGRCEILPGARHMMTVTHPEEVNARLRAFFASAAPCDGGETNNQRK